ncbi:hypothetical protein KW785_02455 [Candidatus Parcubacteria bacterium]|nr:hypothetical protein [Candidatus Parcubacteria bacterium]
MNLFAQNFSREAMFWAFIVVVGIIGAIADIVLGKWSETNQPLWWIAGAVGFLVFMTGLGLIIRQGVSTGYTLTIALVVVILCDVLFVALWEAYKGIRLTPTQWSGLVLAVGAIVCLELGRN